MFSCMSGDMDFRVFFLRLIVNPKSVHALTNRNIKGAMGCVLLCYCGNLCNSMSLIRASFIFFMYFKQEGLNSLLSVRVRKCILSSAKRIFEKQQKKS